MGSLLHMPVAKGQARFASRDTAMEFEIGIGLVFVVNYWVLTGSLREAVQLVPQIEPRRSHYALRSSLGDDVDALAMQGFQLHPERT